MDQFAVNHKTSKAVADVIDYVRNSLKRGDTLTYEKIEEICEYRRDTGEWTGFRVKLEKRLVNEFGNAFRFVTNVGFKLLEADEQVMRCRKDRMKRVRRQLKKAVAEVASAPDLDLSDNTRQHKYMFLSSLEHQQRESRRNPLRKALTEEVPKAVPPNLIPSAVKFSLGGNS